mgnify:CR=1 FL=1|jgi:hypothetical protein
MADKIIKNFSGSHDELMNLFKKAKEQLANHVEIDLESMKMTELRAFAKERGIRGYSGLNKASLINLIDTSLKTLDDS